MEKELAVGRLGSSFGVEGFLKVISFSGEWDHFLDLDTVILKNGPGREVMAVDSIRRKGGTLQIRLKGINSPEAARRYTGWDIYVPRENAAPLKEGEYYHADLCRCRLFCGDREIGPVQAVVEGGNGDLLEVRINGGTVRYIPFIPEYIGNVDIENRAVELLREGILE
jgi:16S rRNA processing protein RimM